MALLAGRSAGMIVLAVYLIVVDWQGWWHSPCHRRSRRYWRSLPAS